MASFTNCYICGTTHWTDQTCPTLYFWQILYDANEANFADYTGERLATELDAEGFSKIRARSAEDAATKAAKQYVHDIADGQADAFVIAICESDPATALTPLTVEVFRIATEYQITATVEDASGRMTVSFDEESEDEEESEVER